LGAEALREKIEAVAFGGFFPFFFVGTGVKFDITALGKDLTTMLLVPAFAVLFLIIRGRQGFVTLLGSVELIADGCRFKQQRPQQHATLQRPRCGTDAWLQT
jgi:Kef-type K+ transport system membrane component KefB